MSMVLKEVRRMFYVIAVVAAFTLLCVLAWTWRDPAAEPAGTTTGVDAPHTGAPTSLEGALVAQLVAGEITPAQYRRAVEVLSARDDERHPMDVPPEIGPADA
ncbi:hypothetical protein ACIBSW_35020 [Actinoplanes sp. NPDC049668]|uniref:hypothetical protein n=1 Tax=unclassified Actinoplanes TaxID=2626549 RepID=UPI0033AAE157